MSFIKLMKISLIGSYFAIYTLCVGMEGAYNNKPSYMCQKCWGSYIGTWKKWEDIDKKIANVHKKMASRVELGISTDISKCKNENSNIAAFAISVEYKNDQFTYVQLPFVVASCKVTPTEDSSAYYWQENGSYIPLISINSFFQSDSSYFFSTVEATKAFVSRINAVLKDDYLLVDNKTEKSEWRLNEALCLLERRVKSGKYLDHLIDPVGTEDGEVNDILRSVLHCEQVVLDRIMNDNGFLGLFLSQLKDNIKREDQITSLNFHIDTYRDMCPKCFLIFKYRKDELKNRICEGLKNCGYNNISGSLKFSLFISSHTPYKIPETGYVTGNINSKAKAVEGALIFQFRNTNIKSIKEQINNIDKKREKKCKEIDDLFEKISELGIAGYNKNVQVKEKKYGEQVNAIKKALNGKKKKEVSNKSKDNNNKVIEDIVAGIVKSEDQYLEQRNKGVKAILEIIEEKIAELSKITYFPFPEQK